MKIFFFVDIEIANGMSDILNYLIRFYLWFICDIVATQIIQVLENVLGHAASVHLNLLVLGYILHCYELDFFNDSLKSFYIT